MTSCDSLHCSSGQETKPRKCGREGPAHLLRLPLHVGWFCCVLDHEGFLPVMVTLCLLPPLLMGSLCQKGYCSEPQEQWHRMSPLCQEVADPQDLQVNGGCSWPLLEWHDTHLYYLIRRRRKQRTVNRERDSWRLWFSARRGKKNISLLPILPLGDILDILRHLGSYFRGKKPKTPCCV